MSDIVKICNIHGELKKENIILRQLKTKMGFRCRICKNEKSRKWKKENAEKVLEGHRIYNNLYSKRNNLKKYGINEIQYNKLLKQQNYNCAICFEKEIYKGINGKIKDLGVDHCHKTGKIRGLLCHKCNRGLGLFNDSINKLESAIQYLKSNS